MPSIRPAFAALNDTFDLLIVGGGATGLGIAVDAATRGYRTALVDSGDFAHATSSRSTKLVHGGVRYLASGQIHLVREALHERAVMLRNAPHLVHPLPTLIPAASWLALGWYGAGLTLYDRLSGKSTMGPTRILGRGAAAQLIPGMKPTAGAILYHDGQFNDARFALALARTALDHGATVLNYVRCERFLYQEGKLSGAILRDMESGAEATLKTRLIVNAAGIFSDSVRTLDEPARPPLLTVSRGAHIVVDAHFLGGRHALMVPKTPDGRVIFAIPWQGSTLIGTTDIPDPAPVDEPAIAPDEIDYLIATINPYLRTPIARADIRSIFSGLRPLVTGKENKTSKLSREHHIDVSHTGLVTIAGGKWTTYRRMAEDTLNFAAKQSLIAAAPCRTDDLPLHGSPATTGTDDPFTSEYGADLPALLEIAAADPTLVRRIDPDLPYTFAMAVYAVRQELARTLEDVLSRRTRALMLNAAATLRSAPAVAAVIAAELQEDQAWIDTQLTTFRTLVQQHYIPHSV
jgi:glycerol-3-phosphate dehydrogenase